MKFITLNNENKVIGIRWGDTIVNGEIQSESGELGQVMQGDGSFITPEPEPVEPKPYEPTNAELAQMLSDLQADFIIAGVI